MKSILLLAVLAVLAVSVSAQSSTGGAAPVASTLCDKLIAAFGKDFSNPADARATMTELVVRTAAGYGTVVTGAFNDAKTKDFFNGNINYRAAGRSPWSGVSQPFNTAPNYAVAGTDQATLVDKLRRFFGQPAGAKTGGGMGCTAYTPADTYVSTTGGTAGTFNQFQIHQNMNITGDVFASFNNQVLKAADSMGLKNAADQSALSAALLSYARNNMAGQQANEICYRDDCPCATGVEGSNCDVPANAASAMSFSFVTLFIAAIVTLLAMRQ